MTFLIYYTIFNAFNFYDIYLFVDKNKNYRKTDPFQNTNINIEYYKLLYDTNGYNTVNGVIVLFC